MRPATAFFAALVLAGCAHRAPRVPDLPYLQESAERWEGAAPPPGAPPELTLALGDAPAWPDGPEPTRRVPVLPVRGAARSGFAVGKKVGSDSFLWLATDRGLLRTGGPAAGAMGPAASVEERPWRYYAGKRWLPDDRVAGLAPDGWGGVWVRTATGHAHITLQPMTLEGKARAFEERVRARHLRHGLVAPCRLERPGDLSSFRTRTDDNDGLWTAIHAAAQAFRFAATGSEDARRRARESYQSLERLQTISGIPGFPARSVVAAGEPTGDGEWHPTADGRWLWKGDTSSDEMDGHLFAALVYHELAADAGERRSIERNVRAMVDHLLEHGGYLVDLDGKPTTWGVWAPEKLNGNPSWWRDRGLNSLEILSYLAVAERISGDPRYRSAARQLIEEHGYARNTLEVKVLHPPEEINHSDDQLAFLCYYTLLHCERDPALRRTYLESLERTFRSEEPEDNPLWNFIALAGGLPDAPDGGGSRAARAVRALQDTPLDMVHWRMENSHRRDLERATHRNRSGQVLAARALHPAERGALKYNADPHVLDAGGGGGEEDDGSFFLLAYWMGRYHGFVQPPPGRAQALIRG